MYIFDKLESEEIEYISDSALLKVNEQDKNISVILTNQRLLLLDYPSKVNNYEEALKSKAVNYIEKKEVILAVNLNDIISIENDKYTLKDTNYFYLKDEELKKYINVK